MSTLLRRAFITVPPLVLGGVLLMHPNDEGDTIYESVRPVVDNWILVHIALLLALPFLVLAAFMLLGGLRGRAATVARVALVFFAVIYTAWEVMVGLSTGILTDYANGLPAAEQAAVAGAIQDFNEHWVTQVALVVALLAGSSRWSRLRSLYAAQEFAGRRSRSSASPPVCDPPAAHGTGRPRVLRCRRTASRAGAHAIESNAAGPRQRVDVEVERNTGGPVTAVPDFLDADLELKR